MTAGETSVPFPLPSWATRKARAAYGPTPDPLADLRRAVARLRADAEQRASRRIFYQVSRFVPLGEAWSIRDPEERQVLVLNAERADVILAAIREIGWTPVPLPAPAPDPTADDEETR